MFAEIVRLPTGGQATEEDALPPFSSRLLAERRPEETKILVDIFLPDAPRRVDTANVRIPYLRRAEEGGGLVLLVRSPRYIYIFIAKLFRPRRRDSSFNLFLLLLDSRRFSTKSVMFLRQTMMLRYLYNLNSCCCASFFNFIPYLILEKRKVVDLSKANDNASIFIEM